MYNGDFQSKWVTSAGVMIPIYNPLTQVTPIPMAPSPRTPFNNQVPEKPVQPRVAESPRCLPVRRSVHHAEQSGIPHPAPPRISSNNFLETQGTSIYPVNEYSIKGDHVFSEKHRISGYYGNDREHRDLRRRRPSPPCPASIPKCNDLTQYSDVLRFSWTWTLPDPTRSTFFHRRRQRLAPGSQSLPGICRQLAEQVLPGKCAQL